MNRASEMVQRILSLDPGDADSLSNAGFVALWSGDYVTARDYYEKGIATEPDSVEWAGALLGYIYMRMGRQKEAQILFDQGLELNQKLIDQGNERSDVRRMLALIHAAQGNNEEALSWLQLAVDAGWRGYSWDEKIPLFENLRKEPRFQQMMAEVKAKVDEMRNRVEAMEKEWEQ
jgi:protein kinase/serine/threonine-protein kinase